jgi:hypothetical protein
MNELKFAPSGPPSMEEIRKMWSATEIGKQSEPIRGADELECYFCRMIFAIQARLLIIKRSARTMDTHASGDIIYETDKIEKELELCSGIGHQLFRPNAK